MRVERIVAAIIVAAAFLAACAPLPAQSDFLLLDGKSDQQYLLVKPADESAPAPLILSLHGYAGDARSIARLWKMQPGMGKAYILAPQAPKKSRGGGAVSTWQSGTDDAFLMALVDKVVKENKIDPSRIAVVGYSAGAFMSLRLALAHPDRFAACVAIGGGLGMKSDDPVTKGKFFLLAGEKDGSFNEKKAQQLAMRLQSGGATVQYEVVPGADHASLYAKIAPATRWLAGLLNLDDKVAK
jgi:poly(3-hydroxybutyrate) depolymerase